MGVVSGWWLVASGRLGARGLAGGAALGRGDTLILAFSHEGRRDPLVGICT